MEENNDDNVEEEEEVEEKPEEEQEQEGVSNGLCEHLRACEQLVRLFLRARAVIRFLLSAASTS